MNKKYQIASMMKDPSVEMALTKALADDGRVSTDEVIKIIRSTFDHRLITKTEFEDIRMLLREARTLNPKSRSLLKHYLKRVQELDIVAECEGPAEEEVKPKKVTLEVPHNVNHIPKTLARRPGTALTPQYLTIHGTANPNSTAANERGWLTNPDNKRNASFHLVVDEKEVVECIPLNEQAWHAGTSAGNNSSIGLEICESGNRTTTLKNAVAVACKILREKNLKADRLRNHKDWSGKNCPRILLDETMRKDKAQTWDWFKKAVANGL